MQFDRPLPEPTKTNDLRVKKGPKHNPEPKSFINLLYLRLPNQNPRLPALLRPSLREPLRRLTAASNRRGLQAKLINIEPVILRQSEYFYLTKRLNLPDIRVFTSSGTHSLFPDLQRNFLNVPVGQVVEKSGSVPVGRLRLRQIEVRPKVLTRDDVVSRPARGFYLNWPLRQRHLSVPDPAGRVLRELLRRLLPGLVGSEKQPAGLSDDQTAPPADQVN
jgi:hypothetical protein